MDITGAGSQPSGKGSADWFTGTVRIDPLFQANDPGRVAGAAVTFEPGAGVPNRGDPAGRRSPTVDWMEKVSDEQYGG